MTLYELTQEYEQLLAMAEDPDIPEEVINDTIEALDGEIEAKADAYATVLSKLDNDVDYIDGEIARLTKMKRHISNTILSMKLDLQSSMTITGKTKFKTERFSYAIQKNPPSVYIKDELAVPDRFKIPQPVRIDKEGIKAFLKSLDENDTCEWAELTQSESLRIR